MASEQDAAGSAGEVPRGLATWYGASPPTPSLPDPAASATLRLRVEVPPASSFPGELAHLLAHHTLPHTLHLAGQPHPPPPLPTLSVVLPLFNERETLPTLHARLCETLGSLGLPAEILFVDDGSSDGSWATLCALQQRDVRVRGLRFARNFGHQTAVSAGLEHARGEWVVVMDSDLQDPPEVIPLLLERAEQGYDVVYAVRRKRKEGVVKRGAYALFYRILAQLSTIPIPLDAGDFCLMNRRVVDHIVRMPERNRFVRGLRTWVGHRQSALEYERDRRHAGEAKYSLVQLCKLALDGLVSFSHRPLRLATATGFALALVGFLWALRTLYMKVIYPDFIAGFTTLVLASLIIGGVQLITIGIIGEYIAHIYDEVKQRPLYIVEERLGEM